MVPCTHNTAFIDDSVKTQRMVAEQCFECPVFDLCQEVGMGEEHGVYAATLGSDPVRKDFRKDLRDDVRRGWKCINGHQLHRLAADGERVPTEHMIDLRGAGILPWESHLPPFGCRRCEEIRDQIGAAQRAEKSDRYDLIA